MKLYEQLLHAKPFFLIAGPCVIEDEHTMLKTAEFLTELTSRLGIPFVFKSSYQKANRTSETAFCGPGLDEGLRLLSKIKSKFNVPVLTDVHETQQVQSTAEVCDILQIPAFLSRQTDLIHAAANTGRIVNIKKGQFMAPEDMLTAAEKVTAMNNFNVLLTERGTTFGYHNLVVDFRSFAILKSIKFPVVYDVTHSLQRPSIGHYSGGTPEYAKMMSQAAIATGMVDGIFIETHPRPIEAMSDSASMLDLSQLESLLHSCILIKQSLE